MDCTKSSIAYFHVLLHAILNMSIRIERPTTILRRRIRHSRLTNGKKPLG
jgi:hypothetical protein